jgi:hypothetical protein
MNRANYTIEDENEVRVLIKDVGPWDQHPTVTNDAERVVEDLAGMLNGRELHYIDSEGDIDQLLVSDGKFAGFNILPRRDPPTSLGGIFGRKPLL